MNLKLLAFLLLSSSVYPFPKGKGTQVISIEMQIGIKDNKVYMDDAPRIMINGRFCECAYCSKKAYVLIIDDYCPYGLCKEHAEEKGIDNKEVKKVEPMKAEDLTPKQ